MCGIIGFSGNDSDLLRRMVETLKHRGPDDTGTFEDEYFSLGHTRLAILDLSARGHQPMSHDNLTISYNGEVYNFREIRRELESSGYSFYSQTDTEVVLKAWHKWGIKAVDKFIGMFAFAIYDKREATVTVVRDRIGIKPVYYYYKDQHFIFASELKPIMEAGLDLTISEEALTEFFQFGYISSGLSIFNDCRKLPAGHYLKYDIGSGKIEISRYWSILPFYEMDKLTGSEDEILDNLEELLVDACKLRTISDVPVGVFLSGGIDSSLLTAILQKHHSPVRTFTVGFREAAFNEADFARNFAEYIGSEHTEKILDAATACDILGDLPGIYDEPLGDNSCIPTVFISRLAKEHGVKVVLSADGGDEQACGYDVYTHAFRIGRKNFSLPGIIRKVFAKSSNKLHLAELTEHFDVCRYSHKFHQLLDVMDSDTWQDVYRIIVQSTKNYEMRRLIGKTNSLSEESFMVGEKENPMQGMMLWDFHRYLVDNILTKVDRATMSASIEGREPLLDHRVVEFMARLPFRMKYHDGCSKYIFRRLLERYVPQEMLTRPKIGFSMPTLAWSRGEMGALMGEKLSAESFPGLPVNESYLRDEYERMIAGKTYNINKLWFGQICSMWVNKYQKYYSCS